MLSKPLGTTDIQLSAVIMGTWQAGKRGWIGVDDAEVVGAIQAAIAAGITTIDTAEIYGNGYSETLVGQAIATQRDRVQLATKVFANHMRYEQVITACDESLKRLGTDWIDLYQIHWPSGAFKSDIVPIAETMSALVELQRQGKIRAIGVSNFSLAQLIEAQTYGRIESIQPPYSLFWRIIEADLAPYCQENKISILAYSALAQGLLTGKFDRDHQFEPQDIRATNRLFQGEVYQRAQDSLDALRPIAANYQCSLATLAIAWVIAQPQACAIVGARNAEQTTANAQASQLTLDAADLSDMDAISRTVTELLDANPVMWNFGE